MIGQSKIKRESLVNDLLRAMSYLGYVLIMLYTNNCLDKVVFRIGFQVKVILHCDKKKFSYSLYYNDVYFR